MDSLKDKDEIEILYIWIKKYKMLENLGFNLSNRYDIEYKPDNTDSLLNKNSDSLGFSGVLSIAKNDSFIEDFFRKRISSLKVLVGKNGTGKTTFIWNLFGEILTSKKIDCVIVLANGQKVQYYSPFDNEITINNSKKIGEIETEKLLKINADALNKILSKIGVFLYTPLINPFNFDSHKNINVRTFSTNYLISQSSSKTIYQKEITITNKFAAEEYNRFCYYIFHSYKSLKNGKHPIYIPQYLQIKLEPEFNSRVKSSISSRKNISVNDRINLNSQLIEIFQLLNIPERIDDLPSKSSNLFLKNLRVLGLVFLGYKHLFISKDASIINNYLKLIWNLIATKPDDQAFELEIDNHQSEIDSKDFWNDLKKLQSLVKTVKNVPLCHSSSTLLTFDLKSNEVYSNLEKAGFFNNLLDLFGSFQNDAPVLFQLSHSMKGGTNLSAGEMYYLALFGRLHSFFLKHKTYIKNRYTLYLVLDEVELAFHPELQQNLINELVEYLDTIDTSNKIRIMITTHSPYILSDVPQNSVLYLTRDKMEKISIVNSKKLTFGANIHELLRDSFFLENSLMGTFALNKINEILKEVTADEQLGEVRIKEIENLINMIGEYVIKNKMLQMLAEKVYKDNSRGVNLNVKN